MTTPQATTKTAKDVEYTFPCPFFIHFEDLKKVLPRAKLAPDGLYYKKSLAALVVFFKNALHENEQVLLTQCVNRWIQTCTEGGMAVHQQ